MGLRFLKKQLAGNWLRGKVSRDEHWKDYTVQTIVKKKKSIYNPFRVAGIK